MYFISKQAFYKYLLPLKKKKSTNKKKAKDWGHKGEERKLERKMLRDLPVVGIMPKEERCKRDSLKNTAWLPQTPSSPAQRRHRGEEIAEEPQRGWKDRKRCRQLFIVLASLEWPRRWRSARRDVLKDKSLKNAEDPGVHTWSGAGSTKMKYPHIHLKKILN